MTYTPGDVVRVTTNAPHGTYLLAGDEVTVHRAVIDEHDRERIFVNTDAGLRALYATDVEMVHAAYRPAEPDPDVDTMFAAIIGSEPDLLAVFNEDADTALGAVEEDLSAVLTEPGTYGDEEESGAPHDSARNGEWVISENDDESTMYVVDWMNDSLAVAYGERTCTLHGRRESAFFFKTQGGVLVSVPADRVPEIVAWLQERVRLSNRPQDPPAAAGAAA